MTNKRLGAGLHVAPRLLLDNRDLLWVNVNIISILNVYTQPKILHVLGYVTHLTPPQCCVVGEDFNVKHDAFEPGILTEDGGYYISQWSVDSGMDYVGEPGRATHRAGHVNDLSFSNVPFDKTKVRTDLNCGTDHEKLVTLIPGRGRAPLEQFHYRIPESRLSQFAGLAHGCAGKERGGCEPAAPVGAPGQ